MVRSIVFVLDCPFQPVRKCIMSDRDVTSANQSVSELLISVLNFKIRFLVSMGNYFAGVATKHSPILVLAK